LEPDELADSEAGARSGGKGLMTVGLRSWTRVVEVLEVREEGRQRTIRSERLDVWRRELNLGKVGDSHP
jgi:hypothetical protein